MYSSLLLDIDPLSHSKGLVNTLPHWHPITTLTRMVSVSQVAVLSHYSPEVVTSHYFGVDGVYWCIA